MIKQIVFGCLIFGFFVSTLSAEVSIWPRYRFDAECANIHVHGEIKSGDARKLATLIGINKTGCIGKLTDGSIFFDSTGGDLNEAMRIGLLIRNNNLSTFVENGAHCMSACNFAFLGGVQRTVYGTFGIHRPYSHDFSIGESDALSKYNELTRAFSYYASKMRVSPELFERMMTISPKDVILLTPGEMASLGVTGTDAVWEEIKISSGAKKYGISKEEYIHRDAAADEICWGDRFIYIDDTLDCVDSIMKTGSPPPSKPIRQTQP